MPSSQMWSQYFVAIPLLRSGSSAIALVAAHASKLLCVHVFEAVQHLPFSTHLDSYTPCDVVATVRILDSPLRDEEWQTIGHAGMEEEAFRALWGVPAFGSVNVETFGFAVRVEVGDDLVSEVRTPCTVREGLRLDDAGVFLGHEGLSDFLEDLLVYKVLRDPFEWHKRTRDANLSR